MVKYSLKVISMTFFFCVLLSSLVYSATYYVDQNHSSASDSNAGTSESAPWLTLDHATDVVVAGDTVIVKAGTYIDTDQTGGIPETRFRSFTTANSGTAGNPITFRSEPALAATIKSKTAETDYTSSAWGLYDVDYVVVDGFTIVGGAVIGYGSTHCTIKNSEITIGFTHSSNLSWGLAITQGHYSTLENNYVHDIYNPSSYTHNSGCIMLHGQSTYNTIKHNTSDAGINDVYNAFGQKGGGNNYNTYSYNMAMNAYNGFHEVSSTDHSITTTGNIYHHNVIYNTKWAFGFDYYVNNQTIYNNTSYLMTNFIGNLSEGPVTGIQQWNNIAANFSNSRSEWSNGTQSVFYHQNNNDISSFLTYSDYNNYYSLPAAFYLHPWATYATSLSSWQSLTTYDDNSISSDPNFVNAGGSDPEDYRRTSYTTDGRGGSYAAVMGAYVTGSETIGYSSSALIIASPRNVRLGD